MHYAASTVPIMRENTVLRWDPGSGEEPKSMELDAFGMRVSLQPEDHLWLMMGATNAAVASGLFRQGVIVHQLSNSRAMPVVRASHNGTSEKGAANGARIKISAADVFGVASTNPDLFYPVHEKQAEILGIMSSWNQVTDSMETRKAYANLVRSRLQQEAVVTGFVKNQQIADSKQLAALIDAEVGKDPADESMRLFLKREAQAIRHLDKAAKDSGLYRQVFAPIHGMGPRIAARFISAIERIERFATARDLSNFAGMLPRGKDGKLPSKKNSKSSGMPLSRSALLNNACYMFQEQMFGYGAHTDLGQMMHGQIQQTCPCNTEMRKSDKELRSRHSEAVRKARISTTRHLLEQIIWPGWRSYMGLNAS